MFSADIGSIGVMDYFDGNVVKMLKNSGKLVIVYLYRFEMSIDEDVVTSNNMDTKAQV